MKFFVVLLALSTVPALAADMKVSGYVGDSMCGAKHNSSAPDAACVKKCIDGGAKPVFVDDAKKRGLHHRRPRLGEGSRGAPRRSGGQGRRIRQDNSHLQAHDAQGPGDTQQHFGNALKISSIAFARVSGFGLPNPFRGRMPLWRTELRHRCMSSH